jgi:hypothetical protein
MASNRLELGSRQLVCTVKVFIWNSETLQASVQDSTEHCMVRHEAAIALGSVAGDNKCIEEFQTKIGDLPIDENNKDEAIVIESC